VSAQGLDIELELLIEAIYHRYSYDFRDYARATLMRRVQHALVPLGCGGISELQGRILHSAQAFMALLQYLTVPVSGMFRDPAYFRALREHVVPLLCTYPSLRIWVAGCSTGEEVYSLAILLHEEGLLTRSLLYATDINPRALSKARRGVYPLDSMRQWTENYQQSGGLGSFADYYTAAYGAALIDKGLRERVIYADHSLATDSVFAETQLISCRNVLIYFNRPLQDRAIGLFHESLGHRGFLGLGSRESLDFSPHGHCFETVARPERVFRKR
jgi:chemotaxis protein methyltransferase CheR